MSVRPHKKRGIDPKFADAWVVDFYDETNVRRRVVCYGSEFDAREIERSMRIRTRRSAPGAFPTLNQAAPHFLDHYQTDHLRQGVERMQWSMGHLLKFFGRYQFRSLTPMLIEQYKRERLGQGVKPTTVNKELAALSSFSKWAHEQGYCERILIKRFPRKMTAAPIPDVPSRNEVVRLLRAIPRKKRGVFAAMYYCGLRVSEAAGLRDGHIKWSMGVMIVTGKGAKQRVVPLNRKVRPYLRSGLPFDAPGDLRPILKWAEKRAGIDRHFYPHLFRHAFGTHMTQQGASLRALQLILGHSSSHITEIYTTLAAEALSREMDKF
ncbi:MAG: tyrosine-type recombinase/integrase [Desulfobulbus sp.]|jgi:site-specific recombinase XerD|uniref:tyrosine-type recombinase/integrase n=1 Tax=Desulfobulbus sp. TaxID=895 RepID=UPI0028491AE8|nr:tyrosine-type recombinase/integrase [Desulfobulbus sp.]MDR2549147.1 tyrosine-type recombinase/integrase [Desulfobulbus sp.]